MAETLANHICGEQFDSWYCPCPRVIGGGGVERFGWLAWCGGGNILLGPERTTMVVMIGVVVSGRCHLPPNYVLILLLRGWGVGGGCGWWVACCLRIAQWMRASLWSSL